MTPEELFYGFPHPVPDVCWQLRDLVMEVAPDAVEKVRPGWRLLGFDLNQYFCAVAPQRDHARLMFERGEANIDYQTSSAYIKNVLPLVERGEAAKNSCPHSVDR